MWLVQFSLSHTSLALSISFYSLHAPLYPVGMCVRACACVCIRECYRELYALLLLFSLSNYKNNNALSWP